MADKNCAAYSSSRIPHWAQSTVASRARVAATASAAASRTPPASPRRKTVLHLPTPPTSPRRMGAVEPNTPRFSPKKKAVAEPATPSASPKRNAATALNIPQPRRKTATELAVPPIKTSFFDTPKQRYVVENVLGPNDKGLSASKWAPKPTAASQPQEPELASSPVATPTPATKPAYPGLSVSRWANPVAEAILQNSLALAGFRRPRRSRDSNSSQTLAWIEYSDAAHHTGNSAASAHELNHSTATNNTQCAAKEPTKRTKGLADSIWAEAVKPRHHGHGHPAVPDYHY